MSAHPDLEPGDVIPCPCSPVHGDCRAPECARFAEKARTHEGCGFCHGTKRVRVVMIREDEIVFESAEPSA